MKGTKRAIILIIVWMIVTTYATLDWALLAVSTSLLVFFTQDWREHR